MLERADQTPIMGASKMAAAKVLKRACDLTRLLRREPKQSRGVLRNLAESIRGFAYAAAWPRPRPEQAKGDLAATNTPAPLPNPLLEYFDARKSGRGILKWRHYFEIYHRHFSRFVGQEVHIAEVGVFSGGSLDMWKAYFGPRCQVYGIDIEPACKCYEGDRVKIFIGDQANRGFWKTFREQVPVLDILVDDGGHLPEQQIITLEEVLPHLHPGGVYLCEDVHWVHHRFAAFVAGLAGSLNAWTGEPGYTTGFQSQIHSVHQYPFVTVIEKGHRVLDRLISERHGTEWQPFL
jgi:hypothetical protein